jgi:polar amino acid transport system ATP-binding protein
VSAPVLELQGVTKAYGDTPVLRGVDLAVNEREAIALIGASGSGKSTLLRCVDLLEEIDDGDVLRCSTATSSPTPRSTRCRCGAGSGSCSSRSTCSRT